MFRLNILLSSVSRRNHHRILILLCICTLSSCSSTEPVLKIGLVADPQYANKATSGKRVYRESIWKLAQAIDTFNRHQVDFVQNLGDIIDEKWESYDSILPVYERLSPEIKNYHVLGNHEFSTDSAHFSKLLKRLSMPEAYYSYNVKGWRFIVLDATDYAYYSNPLRQHDINDIDAYYSKIKGKENAKVWNGAMGPEQLKWLQNELLRAESKNERTIIFSHLPVRPFHSMYNVWNNEEVAAILERSPSVVAYINGHNHEGDYSFESGVHYITMFGMVDTSIGSYGILDIYKDSISLKGYGNQKSLKFDIK